MTQNYKGTIAYGIAPIGGGTTTFYRILAKGLRPRGWRVFSVAIGRSSAQRYDPRFGDDFSVLLAPEETNLAAQVQAFLSWVKQEHVDIVIPMCEDIILAAIPHLPSQTRVITRSGSITRMSYVISTLYLERTSFVVANSIRKFDDLHQRWAVPLTKLRFINNCIELEPFLKTSPKAKTTTQIALVYLGRIVDIDKGVMLLPSILKKVSDRGIMFNCHIIGSGTDSARLQSAISRQGLASRVLFHGQKAPQEIPPLLSQADILLLPSRFEGSSLSLVEAMAAGCVPVASHVPGVTDMVIEDGVNGFLCPVGDTSAFAEKVALLYRDRQRLFQMSRTARQRVREHYSLERMAEEYDRLFTEALALPPPAFTPRPLSQLQYPEELLPTWRTRLPAPLKNLARTYLCRWWGRVDI